MNHIDKFRNLLHKTNESLFDVDHWGDLASIQNVGRAVRKQFGELGSAGPGDKRSIGISVLSYSQDGSLPNYREAKYVCFGISNNYGLGQYCLIEDRKLFPKLLTHVDDYKREPRKFIRCYQGLLLGYFEYPGLVSSNLDGRSNWTTLQGYLKGNLKFVQKQEPPSDWSKILGEHSNLLTDTPCLRYGDALLSGDTRDIDVLREKLTLTDRSWVLQEIILAQIEAATKKSDVQFQEHLKQLLTLLEPSEIIRNKGLGQLLQRYHQGLSPSENIELRDFSLKYWGSPMLQVKRQTWLAWVPEPVMKMVKTWLIFRSIEDFFALLAIDGQARRDRLDFWLRYVDVITDVYFALGANARKNNTADYKRIREHMKGQWMSLEGVPADNNAFLMRIGNSLFVEFGQHGNASHVFQFDNLPFKLGSGSLEGTRDELKNVEHSGHQAKMNHHHGWESEFEWTIQRLTGARPAVPSPMNQQHARRATAAQQLPSFSLEAIRILARTHGYSVTDHTTQGGNLWVEAPMTVKEVFRHQLENWGFKYKPSKGWWKEIG
ncbi:EH signature domain-containing protein [Methylicorpusculum oleiharenae]|uniref:EH signature domain-containing protein n=1 Tax=Methylicorpusculum oleiharenae TaxID=1338687 RepID=UPI001357EACE|nr:EH signature domain-containing protein [Methylicorpusculum oleiharenae]MCD2453806.1 EH signature domain-containing protein [Methylicorpusculum oleiharenae]